MSSFTFKSPVMTEVNGAVDWANPDVSKAGFVLGGRTSGPRRWFSFEGRTLEATRAAMKAEGFIPASIADTIATITPEKKQDQRARNYIIVVATLGRVDDLEVVLCFGPDATKYLAFLNFASGPFPTNYQLLGVQA